MLYIFLCCQKNMRKYLNTRLAFCVDNDICKERYVGTRNLFVLSSFYAPEIIYKANFYF